MKFLRMDSLALSRSPIRAMHFSVLADWPKALTDHYTFPTRNTAVSGASCTILTESLKLRIALFSCRKLKRKKIKFLMNCKQEEQYTTLTAHPVIKEMAK